MIEDDPLFGVLLEEVLGDEGYRVVCCTTGSEGLATAQSEPPGLVLLDLMLPEVDGWTVLRELRRHPATAATPVVMASAVVDRSTAIKRAMVDGILQKPFGIQALIDTVHGVLEASAPAADPE